jgi:hypothetical protein
MILPIVDKFIWFLSNAISMIIPLELFGNNDTFFLYFEKYMTGKVTQRQGRRRGEGEQWNILAKGESVLWLTPLAECDKER